jgi:hypothetical protein
MLSLRARIFIIISVVVLIILAASLILILGSKKNAAPTETPAEETAPPAQVMDQSNFEPNQVININAGEPIPTGVKVKPQTSNEAIKSGVKQIAKIFLERYGTYSTDSNFQNIKDVKDIVSPALWSVLSVKIGVKQVGPFVGMTTSVISTELAGWKDAEATVLLKTIRSQERGGISSSSYQNATVSLIKQGQNWFVDNFIWEK